MHLSYCQATVAFMSVGLEIKFSRRSVINVEHTETKFLKTLRPKKVVSLAALIPEQSKLGSFQKNY